MPDDQVQLVEHGLGKDYIKWSNIERAAQLALEERREAGEVMTYHLNGWVVREYPGQLIVRLAPIDEFRAGDFPERP